MPHWDFYFCDIHSHLASVYVDLSLGSTAPLPTLETLVWVFVTLNDPQNDGLASQAETPALAKLEHVLVPELTKRLQAAYVARATTRGRREFYFYAKSGDGLDDALRSAFAEFPAHRHESGSRRDPAWSHFLDVLFPAPLELQLMHNRHVLQDLGKRGDDGSKERAVAHFLWFADWQARAGLATWARAHEYEVQELPPRDDGPREGKPFALRLTHATAIDLPTLNALVSELFETAEAAGGEYDGWELVV